MVLLIFITNISYQKIGYGTVDKIYNNAYLINNGSYRVLLKTKKVLNYDEKIIFNKNELKKINYDLYSYGFNQKTYYLSKNIQYVLKTNDYSIEKSFSLRSILKKFIDGKEQNIANYYNYFIFGIKNISLYDELNDSIGLSYYGLKLILNKILKIFCDRKRAKIYSSLIMLLFFIFNPSFNLFRIILINFLSIKIKEKNELIGYSYLILIILFPFKIYSISFIFPYVLSIFNVFKSKFLNNKTLIILMTSYFFNSINILKMLFFNFFQIINGFMFILSFLFLFNSFIFEFFIIIYKNILNFLNYNFFEIYGKINILGIIIFLMLSMFFDKIKFIKKQYILIFVLFFNLSNIFSQVCFINVGHGDSILIKENFNKSVILIDTGDEYAYKNVKEFLKAKGIKKIDYLIITHNDKDHCGNVLNLQKDFKINKIVYEHQDIKINNIELLSLNENKENDNDSSIVLYGNINGFNLLFTGDISKKIEKELIKKYPFLKVDILKVAHHGSDTSSDENFIRKIDPFISVISSGNKYKLPKNSVLDTLKRNNIQYFTTKQKGDIEIYFTFFINFIKNSLNEITFFQNS